VTTFEEPGYASVEAWVSDLHRSFRRTGPHDIATHGANDRRQMALAA
jgi:hypothetical protein